MTIKYVIQINEIKYIILSLDILFSGEKISKEITLAPKTNTPQSALVSFLNYYSFTIIIFPKSEFQNKFIYCTTQTSKIHTVK